jgi:hypothetical protein
MTTNPPQIVFNHIVAFEVSKETLVIHTLPDDEQCTIDNKPQAVRRLIKAEIKRNRNKQLCRGVRDIEEEGRADADRHRHRSDFGDGRACLST